MRIRSLLIAAISGNPFFGVSVHAVGSKKTMRFLLPVILLSGIQPVYAQSILQDKTGLGDYAEIRQVWLNHLKNLYNNEEAWTAGEDY